MFSKPHKKGNDGARSSMFNARPTLPKTLENAYLAERHAEAVARHQARNAPAPHPKTSTKRCTTPAETVLALRALRDYRRWTLPQLALFFALPYWKVHQFCSYTTRLDLVPEEDDVPKDAVPPVVEERRGRPPRSKPAPPLLMTGTLRALEDARARKAADPNEIALYDRD